MHTPIYIIRHASLLSLVSCNFRGKMVYLSRLSYNGLAPVERLQLAKIPSYFLFTSVLWGCLPGTSLLVLEYVESWRKLTFFHHKAAKPIRSADRRVHYKAKRQDDDAYLID